MSFKKIIPDFTKKGLNESRLKELLNEKRVIAQCLTSSPNNFVPCHKRTLADKETMKKIVSRLSHDFDPTLETLQNFLQEEEKRASTEVQPQKPSF